MVTASRKIVGLPDVKKTLEKHGIKNTDVLMEELSKLPRKRIKADPAPIGYISINEASRKYGISCTAICKWIKGKRLTNYKKTAFWTFVNEESLCTVINNSKRVKHTN